MDLRVDELDGAPSVNTVTFVATCIANVAKSRIPHYTEEDKEIIKSCLISLYHILARNMDLRVNEVLHGLWILDDFISKPGQEQNLAKERICSLILSCVVIAHKFGTDNGYSNLNFSQFTGATLQSININELYILKTIEWKIMISEETLQKYYKEFVRST